jgi:membrane-associated phospholipid phosphatase
VRAATSGPASVRAQSGHDVEPRDRAEIRPARSRVPVVELMRRGYVMRLRRPQFRGLRTPVATPGQSSRRLTAVGIGAGLLAAAIWAGTTQTYTGQRLADLILYGRFTADPAVGAAANQALATVGLAFVVIASLGLLTVALARGGLGLAVAVVAVLGGSNLTAQLLKDLLERPNLIGNATYASGNSFPSGTVTLVASLGLAAILAAPRSLRTLVAFGAAILIAAVGTSTIATGWHRLADVEGAILISLAWSAIVTAVLVRAQGWMPRRTWGRGLGGRATTGAGIVGIVAVIGGGIGLAVALVDPAPLAHLIATRATTPESFLASLLIAAGTALVATAADIWAMRGVALELPG